MTTAARPWPSRTATSRSTAGASSSSSSTASSRRTERRDGSTRRPPTPRSCSARASSGARPSPRAIASFSLGFTTQRIPVRDVPGSGGGARLGATAESSGQGDSMSVPTRAGRSWARPATRRSTFIRENVLGVVPFPDTVDDQGTARESIGFQERYWRSAGHGGAVVVFMDTGGRAGRRGEGSLLGRGRGEPDHVLRARGRELLRVRHVAGVHRAVQAGVVRPTCSRSLADAQSWIDERNGQAGGRM